MTIAEERIDRLHRLAREAAAADREERGREYVQRARRLAERNRIRLPTSDRERTPGSDSGTATSS